MNLFADPRTIEEIQKDGLFPLFPVQTIEQLQLKVRRQSESPINPA